VAERSWGFKSPSSHHLMSLVRDRLLRSVEGMRFPYLVAMFATLFVIDVLVPDFVPYVDEILLALVTIMVARIRRRGEPTPSAAPERRV
jgi:hypothetical protein